MAIPFDMQNSYTFTSHVESNVISGNISDLNFL